MATSESVTVFINERAFRVRPGLPAAEALAQFDPVLREELRSGAAYLTDGRGIRIGGEVPLSGGAIIRVVRSARGPRAEADAQS